MSEEAVRRFTALIQQYAEASNIPPSVVAATIHIESGGDPKALSPAGAMGLMQGMPDKFAHLEDPFKPSTNLARLVPYLAGRWRAWGRNWSQAMAAYFGAINQAGEITSAKDAGGVDGPTYVNRWWEARLRYIDLDGYRPMPVKPGLEEYAPETGYGDEALIRLKAICDEFAGKSRRDAAKRVASVLVELQHVLAELQRTG